MLSDYDRIALLPVKAYCESGVLVLIVVAGDVFVYKDLHERRNLILIRRISDKLIIGINNNIAAGGNYGGSKPLGG